MTRQKRQLKLIKDEKQMIRHKREELSVNVMGYKAAVNTVTVIIRKKH